MSSAPANDPDSSPVPYKSHRSSSVFGSTGIVSRSGTTSRGFLACSIVAVVFIVIGVTLLIAGALPTVSVTVIGIGVAAAVAGMVVLIRERAAAAKRRVSRPNAGRARVSPPSAKQ